MAREGITRFSGKNEMSDVEFLEVFKELLPYIQKGSLNLGAVKNIDMVEKMDSTFLHMGLNEEGKFFIESSNSGEATVDNYKQKFNHVFFGDHKASFESLLQNKVLQSTLKKIYAKTGPIRFDCELFPMLTHQGDQGGGVTFVATKYDKKKFGTKGAIVVFKSMIKDDNQQWKRPPPDINEKLIDIIEGADTADWRIYTNEKHAKLGGTINFDIGALDPMVETPEAVDTAIADMSARGNTTIKKHLKTVVQDLKMKLQNVLDTKANATSSILGKTGEHSPIEGVILRIKQADGNIVEIKGTSEAFDTMKQQTWKTRSAVGDIEVKMEDRLLKEALGLKTSQGAALNKAVKEVSDNFKTDKTGPEAERDFLGAIYNILKTETAPVGPEVRQKAIQILKETKEEMRALIDAAETEDIDPDSKRKTEQSLGLIVDKMKSLEEAIMASVSDAVYPLHLLKAVMGRRLQSHAGQHLQKTEKDYSKFYEGATLAILWNGRAQPWHIGHDAMIQLAKGKMQELGAQKIVIMLVKGGKSSEDASQNPLTEVEQRQLIETVYAHDKEVEVSPVILASSSTIEIYNKANKAKICIVGWLAGEDRIEEYRKQLARFNAEMWLSDHTMLPVHVNSKGIPDVEMILTPRIMSGTEARETAKSLSFKEWMDKVAPPHVLKDKKAIAMYKTIYGRLNANKLESVRNQVREAFRKVTEDQDTLATKKPDRVEKADDKQKAAEQQPNAPEQQPKPEDKKPNEKPVEKPAEKPAGDIGEMAKEISQLDPEKKLTPEDIDAIINVLRKGGGEPVKPYSPPADTTAKPATPPTPPTQPAA